MDSGGMPVEMLAMIDSGSNTSLLSKNAVIGFINWVDNVNWPP